MQVRGPNVHHVIRAVGGGRTGTTKSLGKVVGRGGGTAIDSTSVWWHIRDL